MVRELLGLPNKPLPPSAPAHKVQHYEAGISRVGSDSLNIQYFWPGSLGKCKWNKQATAHLASEYHDLFQWGKILHNHHVLPYNSTIPIKDFEKKIRIRLQQTQIHWKNANWSPNNIDAPAMPLSTPEELASLWMKESRVWCHGANI